jgi:hypothetical protein
LFSDLASENSQLLASLASILKKLVHTPWILSHTFYNADQGIIIIQEKKYHFIYHRKGQHLSYSVHHPVKKPNTHTHTQTHTHTHTNFQEHRVVTSKLGTTQNGKVQNRHFTKTVIG